MKRRGHRLLRWLAMILGGATMFQAIGFTQSGVGGGCQRFFSNGIASSIDFSYLLDFENGFLGGLVDPCSDPSSPAMFMDCQGLQGTTDTGTTTTGTSSSTQQSDQSSSTSSSWLFF